MATLRELWAYNSDRPLRVQLVLGQLTNQYNILAASPDMKSFFLSDIYGCGIIFNNLRDDWQITREPSESKRLLGWLCIKSHGSLVEGAVLLEDSSINLPLVFYKRIPWLDEPETTR